MFTGRAGRPYTINEGGDGPIVDDWEEGTGSEGEADKEKEKEEEIQEFSADEEGQETPGAGSGQLYQILESTSAIFSSVALLQVQEDRE